jgi:hypothetical protein
MDPDLVFLKQRESVRRLRRIAAPISAKWYMREIVACKKLDGRRTDRRMHSTNWELLGLLYFNGLLASSFITGMRQNIQ